MGVVPLLAASLSRPPRCRTPLPRCPRGWRVLSILPVFEVPSQLVRTFGVRLIVGVAVDRHRFDRRARGPRPAGWRGRSGRARAPTSWLCRRLPANDGLPARAELVLDLPERLGVGHLNQLVVLELGGDFSQLLGDLLEGSGCGALKSSLALLSPAQRETVRRKRVSELLHLADDRVDFLLGSGLRQIS